jgi:hypothetical protein
LTPAVPRRCSLLALSDASQHPAPFGFGLPRKRASPAPAPATRFALCCPSVLAGRPPWLPDSRKARSSSALPSLLQAHECSPTGSFLSRRTAGLEFDPCVPGIIPTF